MFKMYKFKDHIGRLFKDYFNKQNVEIGLSYIFHEDPNAEVRISIGGDVYFVQLTDMELTDNQLV